MSAIVAVSLALYALIGGVGYHVLLGGRSEL